MCKVMEHILKDKNIPLSLFNLGISYTRPGFYAAMIRAAKNTSTSIATSRSCNNFGFFLNEL